MKKEIKKLRDKFEEFLIGIGNSLDEFEKAIKDYLDSGLKRDEKLFEKVGILESECDSLRRGVIGQIIKSNLFSNSQEQFIMLAEQLDRIANRTEKISNEILIIDIDSDILNERDVLEILKITKEQFVKLRKSVVKLFSNYDEAFEIAKSMEEDEQRVDVIEKRVIKSLLNRDISLAEKLYYREFISKIADISDLIENIGDEVEKISIIRKV